MILVPMIQIRKMTIAMVLPYPTLLNPKDTSYIYMERDVVAFPGPPPVSAIADSNIFTDPAKLNVRQVTVTGRKSGRRI